MVKEERITKRKVAWIIKGMQVKYPIHFLQVSNFEDEILLRGGECEARVPYFRLSCSSRLFYVIKTYFI